MSAQLNGAANDGVLASQAQAEPIVTPPTDSTEPTGYFEATPSDAPAGQPQSSATDGPAAPAVESATTTEGASAETQTATAETEEAQTEESQQDDPAVASEVKRDGRKMWATYKDVGGMPAFEAAHSLVAPFLFDDKPEEFVTGLKQYPAKYYPVRNEIVLETVERQGEELLQLLQQTYPDLNITFGKKEEAPTPPAQAAQQPAPRQADAYDPLAEARAILADPLANEQDRAWARYTVGLADEVEKLRREVAPLSEKATKFVELSEQQQRAEAERLEAEAEARVESYVGGLTTVAVGVAEQAGLKSPEDLRDVITLVRGYFRDDQQGMKKLAEAERFVRDGDLKSADLLLPSLRARVEQFAARAVQRIAGPQAQVRAAESQKLTEEKPRVVTGGEAALSSSRPAAPAFDEEAMSSAFQEILQRGPGG